jgi:serine/threonine protein kinase
VEDPLIQKRVLGRYRVIRSLAVGGMGIIYLGRSEGAAGFAKPVVIKRVIPDFAAADSNALEFFIREATILAQLRDPGIVTVLDFGEDEGAYTMVLEYVHGYHLGQWLRYFQRTSADFPAELAIHIVCLVLDALQHAHHLKQPDGSIMRVVHRDVTPSNVLIDIDGHVKLADFGIARISRDDEEKTQSGLLRGKMAYLAPELLHGQAASVASDVYSAAVMLHELIQGRNDFRSDIPAETVRLVLHADPTPLEVVRKDVPRGIDAVMTRGLAKDPKQRYASAREFREALRGLLTTPADELQRRLDAATKSDFAEKLPEALGLEPLADRETAWRSAPTSDRPEAGTPTSAVPKLLAAPPVYVNAHLPPSHDGATARLDLPTRSYNTGTGRLNAARVRDTEDGPAPAPSRKSLYVAIAAAAIMVGASVGGAAFYFGRQEPERARFIVIDHTPDEDDDAVDSAPGAPVAAAQLTTANGRVDSGVVSRVSRDGGSTSGSAVNATAPRPGESTLARLTRIFGARRGAVRSCFERHTVGLAGAPAIEIRFHVATTGQVTQANLAPASVEGTDLGRCILGVARGAQFGVLEQAVSFSIPFTAAHVAR